MTIIKMYSIFARETLREMKFEGKLAAQAGHAYLHAYWDAEDRFGDDAYPINYGSTAEYPLGSGHWIYEYQDTILDYRRGMDSRKIALVVDTVDDLKHLYELYRPYMGATFVEDCAYTVFTDTTVTAVGLGPVRDDWFEEGALLKRLETLKREIK